MSVAIIQKSPIAGLLMPPPSKSAGHRALICAALAALQNRGEGVCYRVSRLLDPSGSALSDDLAATLRAIRAMGVNATADADALILTAGSRPSGSAEVDCGESGSTLRFFLPLFAALGLPARFTGRGRLPDRPLGVYADCLPTHGVSLSFSASGGCLPLDLSGHLTGGAFLLPGDISSQFISGLLLALPLCNEDSTVRLSTPLESADYVNMTIQALSQAGIEIKILPDGWFIPGGQRYRSFHTAVESDWSQAAFLLAAGALGGEVRLPGLKLDSSQGDRAALTLFRRMGAEIFISQGIIRCRRAPLRGIDIDATQIPDLVPILAVAGSLAEGETRITGAARLRIKESDRLKATADGLSRLGARVEERPDGLVLQGVPRLKGGQVSGYHDHRIVMSMAVAALQCDQPVEVTDAESVQKSWPDFFADFRRIGGNVHVVD